MVKLYNISDWKQLILEWSDCVIADSTNIMLNSQTSLRGATISSDEAIQKND